MDLILCIVMTDETLARSLRQIMYICGEVREGEKREEEEKEDTPRTVLLGQWILHGLAKAFKIL